MKSRHRMIPAMASGLTVFVALSLAGHSQSLLSVDFQNTTTPFAGATQAGFQPFENDGNGVSPASRTFSSSAGDIEVELSGHQFSVLEGLFSRGGVTNGGNLTVADIYNDFAFNNDGDGATLRLEISGPGIRADADYSLTFYSYDSGLGDNNVIGHTHSVAYTGTAGTAGSAGPLEYASTVNPEADDEYSTTGVFTSDGSGVLTIEMTDTIQADSLDGIRLNAFTLTPIGPPPAPFQLTITRVPSGFDLAWESRAGMLYNLWSSPDLLGEVSTWTLVEGDLVATPGENIKTVSPSETMLFYVVEEFPAPPPPPLFSEDFEDDDGGFTLKIAGGGFTPTGSPWVHGTPTSSGDGGNSNPGGSVVTGNGGSTKCWGINIGQPGFYLDPTETCLLSPIIDLTSVTAARLSFAQALDLDLFDTAAVNIVEAATGSPIQTNIVTITDLDLATADWEELSGIVLPVGQMIQIEWCFSNSGGQTDFMGWYIDDVVVVETTP